MGMSGQLTRGGQALGQTIIPHITAIFCAGNNTRQGNAPAQIGGK